MQEELRNLRTANPEFWTALTTVSARRAKPSKTEIEDIIPEPDEEDLDDSDISFNDVLSATHREEPSSLRRGRISKQERGGLTTVADAEKLDEVPIPIKEGETRDGGRGKRKKTANRLYGLADFARHWDNEASDVE
jgi:hypothetical protein